MNAMMKMKTILGVMASAAVCALALAGCSRESMEKETGEVKFSFSSVPATTRTEFQNYTGYPEGVTPTGQGITTEQVNWVVGDVVTIWSDYATKLDGTHVSEYEVSSLEGRASDNNGVLASVDNHGSGGGLRWKDESTVHKFLAVYGANASISTSGSGQTVTGANIPDIQRLTWNNDNTVGKTPMTYAYMVGLLETAYQTPSVTLPLRQMYTAFQFTVSSGDNAEVGLTSFTLSSTTTALAGGFTVAYPATANIDNLAIVPTSPDSKSITVNFPLGFKVVNGKPVTFTVLALGQSLTNLSITFVGDQIGTRTLALKKNNGDFITFTPSTKNLINGLSFPNLLEATGEDIIWEQTAIGEPISWQDDGYVLGHVDPSDLTYLGGTSTNGAVISYKVVDGNLVATPWTVLGYYPTEADAQAGTNPYADLPATGWVTSFPASGIGAASVDGQSVSIDYDAAEGISVKNDLEKQVNDEIAQSTFGVGSTAAAPYNLSNPGNKTSSVIVESANSYIVNGAGYYKIPIVMGNGVKNNDIYGGPENTGYNYTGLRVGSGSTPSTIFANYFYDYKGQQITSPLVHKSNSSTTAANKAGTPTAAFVVWEDPLLIETDGTTGNTGWNLPAGAITIQESALENGDDIYWLNFHVGGDGITVKQGNAVIAVTDENGTVMWSYHIWVTNYQPLSSSDVTVDNRANYAYTGYTFTETYQLMPCNLGWIFKHGEDSMTYPLTELYVRIRQTESGKVDVMKVIRPEYSVVTHYHDGYGPSYQWGRKDALHPIGTTFGTEGSTQSLNALPGGRFKDFTTANADINFGATKISTAIKNPGIFYTSGTGTTVWSGYYAMRNMWTYGDMKPGTNAQTQYSYDAGSDPKRDFLEKEVWKTIYDPSPAGYSLPAEAAFAFRPGYEFSRIESDTPLSLEKFDQLNVAATYVDANGRFIGYSLYTDATKTATAFFPTSGYRSYYSGTPTDVGKAGYFWIAMRSANNVSGSDFTIYYNWSGEGYSHAYGLNLWHNMPQNDGFCVRPMRNTK